MPEWFDIAKGCYETGQYNEAIELAESFIKSHPDDVNVAYAYDIIGLCYAAIEDFPYTNAMSAYTTAIERNTKCESALHNRGLLYMKIAEEDNLSESEKIDALEKAISDINTAISIEPDSWYFHHSAASCHEQWIVVWSEDTESEKIINFFNIALGHYETALELSKRQQGDTKFYNIILNNLTECLAQFGHFWYRSNRYDKAMEYYNKVLKQDPTHAFVLYQIGMTYSSKQENFEEAQDAFKKAQDAFKGIASISTDLGDIEEASTNDEDALTEEERVARTSLYSFFQSVCSVPPPELTSPTCSM